MRSIQRHVHRARLLAAAPLLPWTYFVAHPYAPLLAQVVVTRRCNLKCGYCNEFDRSSAPVPRERIAATVERLAALHTRAVAFTGGEPTLHPELPEIVRHAAQRIARVSMITNGYKLTRELVLELGAAGLGRMQISLDGVEPNDTTAKVLRCTARKLELLAEHATFPVHINAVLGAIPLAETRQIVRFARSLAFETTVQWLHDSDGQALNPHGITAADLESLAADLDRPPHHDPAVLSAGLSSRPAGASSWKCRAGARYLYVDEFSTARFCSQQRDLWSKPVDELREDDLRANFHTPKPCAERCTLGCVRDASQYDSLRAQNPARAGDAA